ncbi:hypothetical protein GB931_13005 [Modestobacter sp. I12A-02628]|uniref:Uncharacterized protein n=1 Tax=Goekera deserti TaxID=2497753 RepID=A0A7K3W9W7_9ACTN|nr:hypothetical protein [Goekera deserti]MPQ98821.1 hypothetical protein [Goekera deserti]NDI49680.1 hypothetical protein [Goekera deserti]NEL53127.1 hypothetical protein [Goekera deserti]
MPDDFDIESQGDHQYVVRLEDQGETVETWFRLTPEALDKLGADDEDEEDLVRRTVTFLSKHQDVADFPDTVEIEDVIASYDDYLDYMNS